MYVTRYVNILDATEITEKVPKPNTVKMTSQYFYMLIYALQNRSVAFRMP